MKCFRTLLFYACAIAILLTSLNSYSEEEKKGWLREKIKNRFIKKMEEFPAPEASTDLQSKVEKSGTYTFSFMFEKQVRYYIVHVPHSYNSKIPTPLVFSFHGGGGDMSIQSNNEFYKTISKSESEGFIIIFPNGISPFKSGKLATWNAGTCCGKARDTKADDVGFVKEILRHTIHQLNVDQKRFFAMGMSNGGMMSYRLACELPDVFKAIASVAGTDNTIDCNPKTAISILHIHAQNDDHVLFKGGAGKAFTDDKSKVTNFTSVPDTVLKWVKLNQCQTTPTKMLKTAGAFCDLYSKCKNKVEVKLCVTESGGHSWPGGKKPRGGIFEESPSTAISATDMIWDFFKNH